MINIVNSLIDMLIEMAPRRDVEAEIFIGSGGRGSLAIATRLFDNRLTMED